MATFTLLARPVRGTGSRVRLYLRITALRKSTFVSSGLVLPGAMWNASRGEVRKAYIHADTHNRLLSRMAADAEAAYHEARADGDAAHAVEAAREAALNVVGRSERVPDDVLVTALLESARAEANARGAFASAAKIRTIIHHVEAFEQHRRAPLVAVALDRPGVEAFDRFLERTQGLRPNSRSSALRGLRAALGHAEGAGTLPVGTAASAFVGFTMPSEATDKARLTRDEVDMLARYAEACSSKALRDAADFFLLSVDLFGSRAGDVLRLRPAMVTSAGGVPSAVSFRQGKTGKPLSIPLTPRASEILGRWIDRAARAQVPMLAPQMSKRAARTDVEVFASVKKATSAINSALARASTEAGIEGKKVTTHVARYTFGALAREAGLTDDQIQGLYAHGSAQVTDGYLGELSAEEVRRHAARLLG